MKLATEVLKSVLAAPLRAHISLVMLTSCIGAMKGTITKPPPLALPSSPSLSHDKGTVTKPLLLATVVFPIPPVHQRTSLLWSVMSSRSRVTMSLTTGEEQCLLARKSPLSTSLLMSFTNCRWKEQTVVPSSGSTHCRGFG